MDLQKTKLEQIYIPRKCSFSNKILASKDYSSTQLSIGIVDKKGLYIGKNKLFASSGFLRRKGKNDQALNFLFEEIDNF
jgi:small subunit ribosomal protein S21e